MILYFTSYTSINFNIPYEYYKRNYFVYLYSNKIIIDIDREKSAYRHKASLLNKYNYYEILQIVLTDLVMNIHTLSIKPFTFYFHKSEHY